MFQWPKIPEILMSIRDYKAIGDFFIKPPVVRLYQPCTQCIIQSMLDMCGMWCEYDIGCMWCMYVFSV